MSTPAPASTEEPLDYRPLSGLALAGFGIGLLYAAVITIGGMLSLFRGQPFLLAGWTLLLPVGGAIVSYLGQTHVRNSEGTRAGLKLARWGLGISVGFGLAYFLYSLGTSLAIRQQANTAAREFLESLRKSAASAKHFNQAFLATELPQDRDRAASENEAAMHEQFGRPQPGGLSRMSLFRDHPLPRFFACGAESELKFEPLGVVEWRYELNGFVVRRLYKLTNEEAEVEALLTTRSIEGKAGDTRKWIIDKKESYIDKDKIQPKPILKALMKLRTQAWEFAFHWSMDLAKGESWTLPDSDMAERLLADPNLSLALYKKLQSKFADKTPNRLGIDFSKEALWMRWTREEGKLKFTIPCKVMLAPEGKKPSLVFNGEIEVRTRDTVAAITESLAPEWEIVRLNIDQILERTESGYGPLTAASE